MSINSKSPRRVALVAWEAGKAWFIVSALSSTIPANVGKAGCLSIPF